MDDRLKVGNKCYLKAQGNEEKRHREKPFGEWIYECEITKVGRKYFEVSKNGWNFKYDIETLSEHTNYCSNWKFYFDKQDALDDMEYNKLETDLRIIFSSYSNKDYSLDQLRRIVDIIKE